MCPTQCPWLAVQQAGWNVAEIAWGGVPRCPGTPPPQLTHSRHHAPSVQGVPQDWVRAAAIYYEAYQERNAEAMFNLGFMHEFGAGVPKDLQLARKFYLMTSHTMPDARYAVQVSAPLCIACPACAGMWVHGCAALAA